MEKSCTISDSILHNNDDTLRISPGMSLTLPINYSESLELSFDVLIPAGGKGDEEVSMWVTDNGNEISRLGASGAAQPEWRTIGPLPINPGEHKLIWNTAASKTGDWPAGVDGFYLGDVSLNNNPISLKLWCDTSYTAEFASSLQSDTDNPPPDFYITSFEDTGILYFLRYIPWLDWSSIDWITYVRQSDQYALNGKYSAQFVQVPPYGASTLWSRELDIPPTSSHVSISFGCLAIMPAAQIGYKLYFDGVLTKDQVGPVLSANAWFRVFIDSAISIGARKFKFEISLEPLPNIPLDNTFYIDDLAVDFGRPPADPPRTLVFGDLNGNVYGLNNLTGSQLWKTTIPNGYTTARALVTADVAYYSGNSTPGLVSARNAFTGDQIWSQSIPAAVDVAPALVGTTLYVTAANGVLYGLNRATGAINYQGTVMTPSTGLTVFANVIVGGVAYITSSLGVHAFNIAAKTVKWTFSSSYGVKQAPVLWDRYIFFGCTDGKFEALDIETGSAAWPPLSTGEPIYTTPQMVGGLVVFGTDSGNLYCLNAMTGAQVWKISKSGRIRGFKVSDDRVYLVSNDVQGVFYAYDYQINEQGQWSFTQAWTKPVSGGIQQSPLITDDVIYFTGGDKTTYALDPETGNQLWAFQSTGLSFVTPALQEAPAIKDLSRRYDQCCYLTAHNAYANTANGWIYAEQSYSLTAQLEDGVRGLMLDAGITQCKLEHSGIGPDIERVCGPRVQAPPDIYFIHEDLTRTSLALVPLGFDSLRKFSVGLSEIRRWLDNNPNEVVTILLESQVDNSTLMTQALQDGGVTDIIFWADKTNQGPNGSWNVGSQGWPPLQWMVTANKRLVILSQHRSGADGLPDVWAYAVENDFGNRGLAPGCNARTGSRPLNDTSRALFVMNYFVDWSVSHAIWYPFHYSTQNDYFSIVAKVNECANFAQRLPNFLAVDFYQRGNNGGPKAANTALDNRWRSQITSIAWKPR